VIVFVAVALAFAVAVWIRIDHRIPIGVGLLMLVATGASLAVDQRPAANLFATIAFFALVFGTLIALAEILRTSLARKLGRTRDERRSRVKRDTLVESDEDRSL
jgi:hypothetical protein